MKIGPKYPHHRELYADMSQQTVTTNMRLLLTKFPFFFVYKVRFQVGNFPNKRRIFVYDAIVCYDILA